ncbi:MAG: hypothetical protein U0350_03320 [Caldilineaceae bacterium]
MRPPTCAAVRLVGGFVAGEGVDPLASGDEGGSEEAVANTTCPARPAPAAAVSLIQARGPATCRARARLATV